MTLTHRTTLVSMLALVVVAVASACGGAVSSAPESSSNDEPTATKTVTTESTVATVEPVDGPQYGVAGLIPRNFPSSETADWVAMYEGLGETGDLLGIYGGWTDAETARGEVPVVFRSAFAASEQYEFTPVIGIGVFSENVLTGELMPTVDWSDAADRQRYREVAVAIAREQAPPFMIIGAEINRMWEQHPDAFDGFVAAWPELYAAIKAASPGTQVGTGFQLEFLRGDGYLSGETREPAWALLDSFMGQIDVVAFSSYPYFDFGTPEAMPDSYYVEAWKRAGVPIGITEMGWPSRPLYTAPESEYGGTPEEQMAFVSRFLELTADIELAFALWSFQHDLGEAGGPAFDSVALRENDGTPKPALEVWGAASAQ
jgi:hypothetical protein